MAEDKTPSTAIGEQRRQVNLNESVERLEAQLQKLEVTMSLQKQSSPKTQLPVGPKVVQKIIRTRRVREAILGKELFADPAWDMLLELYAAELAQQRVATKDLCKAAAVPPTTALRWIDKLQDLRWVDRREDPKDRRRIFVELTGRGSEAMQQYFSSVGASGL